MPAISFTVTRTGDLSKTGSVNWALAGSILDSDLAQGQAKSGTLSWAANETASKTVVINTVGNTLDQSDRECQVQLSSPVNATISVATAVTTIVDDDATTVTGWPTDFGKTPPTFTGTVVKVDTAAKLTAAIGASAPATGDIRVSCAAGVDYGTIQVNKPGRRIQIVVDTPPFGSLDTTQRSDLAITSTNMNNARDKVVKGTVVSMANGAGINLVPVACSVLWVENFYFRTGQRIVRQTSALNFDTWVRRCRIGNSEGGLIRLGGTSQGFKSLCMWEVWLWGDGDRTDARGPNPFACYTDYGCQLYRATDGVYIYKCFFEEGLSHMLSAKKKINKMMVYNTVFMPYTSLSDPLFTVLVTAQLGQEGTDERKEDNTCGMSVFRYNTFGSWTQRASSMRHSVITMQDANGCILENNLFYSQASHVIRMLEVTASGGHTASDIDLGTVDAGGGGVRIANNKMLGRTPVTLQNLYPTASWGGCNIRFEENDVPEVATKGNIDVGTVGGKVHPTFGTNPGYKT